MTLHAPSISEKRSNFVLLDLAYCIYRFLRNANVNFALTTLFFAHHGIGFSSFMILDAVYFVSKFLFEPINGYLADRFGRRLLLITSSLALALATYLMVASPLFTTFLLTQVLTGYAQSIQRGVASAHIYEVLAAAAREQYYKKTESLGQFATTVAMALSTLLGGFVAEHRGIDAAWTVTSMFMLLSVGPIVFLGTSQEKTGVPRAPYSAVSAFRDALEDVRISPIFRMALLVYAIGFCTTRLGFWMVQQALSAQDIRLLSAGIWTFFVYLLSSLVSLLYGSRRFESLFTPKSVVMACLFQLSLFCMSFYCTGAWFWFVFAVACSLLGVAYGFYQPLAIPLAQAATENARRATAISFLSTGASFSYVVISAVIATAMHWISMPAAIGLICLVFMFSFAKVFFR